MPPPVMRDHAIAALPEKQHLPIPVVPAQWPAMRKHDRPSCAPILIENFRAVFGRNRGHNSLRFLYHQSSVPLFPSGLHGRDAFPAYIVTYSGPARPIHQIFLPRAPSPSPPLLLGSSAAHLSPANAKAVAKSRQSHGSPPETPPRLLSTACCML